MKRISFLILLAILTLSNCNKQGVKIIRSFCYWKTTNNVSNDTLLQQMEVKHMYVRFFDVDYNPYVKEAMPVATFTGAYTFSTLPLNITPSVYITNEVMLLSTKPQLDTLARKMCNRILTMYADFNIEIAKTKARYNYYKLPEASKNNYNEDSIVKIEVAKMNATPHELLLDCDWTEQSKDNYFYFLKSLKKIAPNTTTQATIRLWQYKYMSKAGVPPTDKGLLMCYNMSNLKDYKIDNSIGSSKVLKEYLTHKIYALKLDVALPLFSWNVVFRGGKYKGILPESVDFTTNNTTFKKVSDNNYVLMDDVPLQNSYLRIGDEIRIEKISDNEINSMITTINNCISIDTTTKITLFSFDKKHIDSYGTHNINAFYKRF
jgi:hypothetical protein